MWDEHSFDARSFDSRSWWLEIREQIDLWLEYERRYRTITIDAEARYLYKESLWRDSIFDVSGVTMLASERQILTASEVRITIPEIGQRSTLNQSLKKRELDA
jgi:hypothetical protein